MTPACEDAAMSMERRTDAPRNHATSSRLCFTDRVKIVGLILVCFMVIKDTGAAQPVKLPTSGDTCDDIAIIGVGIAGSYAAWKLREQGLAITMYEFSDRIGGRMHTIQFREIPDINVELGAMRFVEPAHQLMMNTAIALNLTIVDSKEGLVAREDDMYYLRGVHLRQRELRNQTNPYNLSPEESKYANDTEQLKWIYFVNRTSFDPKMQLNDHAKLFSTTDDGVPLFEQSTDVAFSTMGVSHEAVRYIRDINGFYCNFGDAMASAAVPSYGKGSGSTFSFKLKTIGEGMEALPRGLVREFMEASPSHRMVYNRELVNIEKQQDETFKLSFFPTETVSGSSRRIKDHQEVTICAKKIILCIPRQALELLKWDGLRNPEIGNLVKHSIKDVPAAKIFLAYDQPWWKGLAKTFSHSVSDLPNRQTYDFGTSQGNNKSVLLAAYMDMDDVKFWRELRSRDTSSSGPGYTINEASLFHINNMLAKVFNVSVTDIPKAREGVMSLWDEYPFGAGWYTWMPGYIWNDVEKRIIKPSLTDQVYVASNGFTPAASSWAESALEVVEMVIQKMGVL